jgi:endoglucanase
MLLAVAVDDRTRFAAAWRWSRRHLLLADGLLASQWARGRVVNSQPASDADLDTAHALVLASERFGQASYKRAGEAMARAVLANETEQVGGATVLVAGPWARGNPAVLDASYFSPRAYADLDRADPDRRWAELAASSRMITEQLLARGRTLPPDWAAAPLGPVLEAHAIGNPEAPSAPSPPPASSFDAFRVATRFTASCVAEDRRVAAEEWPLYRRAPGRDSYGLNGTPQTALTHPASLVAAAAAAEAAGDRNRTTQLLGAAQAVNAEHPTYYGAAWVALGRVMLTTSALGTC